MRVSADTKGVKFFELDIYFMVYVGSVKIKEFPGNRETETTEYKYKKF
jgi:hypothetical protein